MGKLESSTAHRGYGLLYERIPTIAEIDQKHKRRSCLERQYEELQRLGAALHRAQERGDARETLAAIDETDRTALRYGSGQVCG